MGRDAALTGISLFFLEYGYVIKPLDFQLASLAPSMYTSLIEQVNELVRKL